MNNPFIAELIGTMLLIIFGDGVVANVLLNKTKGQNSGWIVIATGWPWLSLSACMHLGRSAVLTLSPHFEIVLASRQTLSQAVLVRACTQ